MRKVRPSISAELMKLKKVGRYNFTVAGHKTQPQHNKAIARGRITEQQNKQQTTSPTTNEPWRPPCSPSSRTQGAGLIPVSFECQRGPYNFPSKGEAGGTR